MPWTLYPRNSETTLDPELFRHPTCEYRGTPFWAWNSRLQRERLLREIEQMKAMGLGGFHMHSRVGLATPYLSDEFMDLVRACVDKAREEKMLAWLYDEDRWPSGAAGGLVTSDPQHRQRQLRVTTDAAKAAEGEILARYTVEWRGPEQLAGYARLADEAEAARDAVVLLAVLETMSPSSWYNNQTYLDTLSPKAVQRFIEVTHERYAEVVGDAFGRVVPAIFTDEPQYRPAIWEPDGDVLLPFTDDFARTYQRTYGEDLLDVLPEVIFEQADHTPARPRLRFWTHVAERFGSAFNDQIGEWCEQHGIALTGHMMAEASLGSQTQWVAECMRQYRKFQLPGIDMLCDNFEFTTAKQAQSVARQYGRPGVMSELYGVTNWDFDFAGHKRQGDWQAALGITVRVHHLTWYSMAGEAKRDYPASIGYQSPWYPEYPLVEDHFARVNTVMTRGKPLARVGVIHPIESYWLHYGPPGLRQSTAGDLDGTFKDVTEWLLHGLMDFDFISEALLPEQCPLPAGAPLTVGEMNYGVIVLPALDTIRESTMARLENFAAAGGEVIFLGKVPLLVDGQPSDRPARLAENALQVPPARGALLDALEAWREVDVRSASGTRPDGLLYQLRQDGDGRHLFVCNTSRNQGLTDLSLCVKGSYDAVLLDTLTGEQQPHPAQADEWTTIRTDLPAHGHCLFRLAPSSGTASAAPAAPVGRHEVARLQDPVDVTLSEPNVLLLDQAEYQVDGGDWQPRTELLRLANQVREERGLPLKGGRMAQPWTDQAEASEPYRLGLRFEVVSEVDVPAPRLALEDPGEWTLQIDGREVPLHADGWWVDEDIATATLPDLEAGRHEFILSRNFGARTDVEWFYLLGDFGVRVSGSRARLTAPVRQLSFGDWTTQGLPFYAGNVTYHCHIPGGKRRAIEVPRFRAPVLTVDLEGRRAGAIAFAPYRLELETSSAGDHRLDITAFGNRVNAFGPVHNCNPELRWVGPQAWRSSGADWCDEYQLRPMGILAAPMVMEQT